MNCTKKVFDCSVVLSPHNLTIEEKKNNLKNIIINHIEGNYADFDPSTDTSITLLETVNKLDENDKKVDSAYFLDIITAITLGMEMIQENHVHLIKERGKKRLTEPIYSYDLNGNLTSITILTSALTPKTLKQIAKYFDTRFMINNNVRTLKIR